MWGHKTVQWLYSCELYYNFKTVGRTAFEFEVRVLMVLSVASDDHLGVSIMSATFGPWGHVHPVLWMSPKGFSGFEAGSHVPVPPGQFLPTAT